MKQKLFDLIDGTEVFKGDILYHPDSVRVGWHCRAYFLPKGDEVTVISPNGAVPTVLIADLRKEPPPQKRCKLCNQLLPNNG